jgi:hypothetical protein
LLVNSRGRERKREISLKQSGNLESDFGLLLLAPTEVLVINFGQNH